MRSAMMAGICYRKRVLMMKPILKWLDRRMQGLTMVRKFTVIAVAVVIPLGIALWVATSLKLSALDASELELLGVDYQRQALPLLDGMARYRSALSAKVANLPAAKSPDEMRDVVNSKIETIRKRLDADHDALQRATLRRTAA